MTLLGTLAVVPAKAGTHNHRIELLSTLGPQRRATRTFVVMGPCVLEVCQDEGGREAVGSLALDAVSRLGLPPVPSINLNSCTRLRQQTSHHRDRHRDHSSSLRRNRHLQETPRYL